MINCRIYPEMFSTRMIYHWSSGIFQDNNRTQRLALNYLLRIVQMNEDQFQSSTIWPYIIHVYMNVFKVLYDHSFFTTRLSLFSTVDKEFPLSSALVVEKCIKLSSVILNASVLKPD